MNTTNFVFGYKRKEIASILNACIPEIIEHFDNLKGWVADLTEGQWYISDDILAAFRTKIPRTLHMKRFKQICFYSQADQRKSYMLEWDKEGQKLTLYSPEEYVGIIPV